ncbi:MAG: metal-dependent hydrolase [Aliishimia sp.]
MNIIWLGHGSFRIEIAGETLLVDPWLTGNPMLSEAQHEAATGGASHILATHAHFDHIADVPAISKAQNAPVSGPYELANHLFSQGAVEGNAFNKGGTIHIGDVSVTMVPASHSSSTMIDDRPVYMAAEVGFMIKGEGKCIYISGDTDVMADMDWMGDMHKPDIGILSAGGYFTMDMAGAAYAAKRYFNFSTVIPCHYRTFPLLEQNADVLQAELANANVIEPEVLQAITL